MSTRTLQLQPLTAEAFASFGTVVELDEMDPLPINEGYTLKFGDLLPLDCKHEGGRVAMHFYRSKARSLPIELEGMERHPLGSQAFWPLQNQPYAVVVAPPSEKLDESAIQGFITSGRQAIQYHRGTWHHYQISLDADTDFIVLDREGPGNNCDEIALATPLTILL